MPSTLHVPDLSDPVPPPADDLSALAWVQDELRRSLDAAHRALPAASDSLVFSTTPWVERSIAPTASCVSV